MENTYGKISVVRTGRKWKDIEIYHTAVGCEGGIS
jgi:hypothetical protein